MTGLTEEVPRGPGTTRQAPFPGGGAPSARGIGGARRRRSPAGGVPLPLPDEVVRPRLLDRLDRALAPPGHGDPGRGRLRQVDAPRPGGAGQRRSSPRASTSGTPAPRVTSTATCSGRALLRALSASTLGSTIRPGRSPTPWPATRRSTCASCSTTPTRSGPVRRGPTWSIASCAGCPTTGTSSWRRATPCPSALSRLRAADRLVEITQDDLLFTADRDRGDGAPGSGASRRRRSPWAVGRPSCAWPWRCEPDVAIDFAQEEVLSQLKPTSAERCSPSSNLGYADRDRVAGSSGADVDLAHLARTVPARVPYRGRSVPRPRPLGRGARCASSPRDEVAELRTACVERARRRRATWPGPAPSRWPTRTSTPWPRIALEVVRRHVAALPIDMVRPWIEVLQRGRPDAPETQLLGAALRQALDFTDGAPMPTPTPPRPASASAVTPTVRSSALVVGTVGSYMPRRRRPTRRAHASGPRPFPGSRDHPTIDVALRAIAAIGAEMSGDLDARPRRARGRARSTASRRRSGARSPASWSTACCSAAGPTRRSRSPAAC